MVCSHMLALLSATGKCQPLLLVWFKYFILIEICTLKKKMYLCCNVQYLHYIIRCPLCITQACPSADLWQQAQLRPGRGTPHSLRPALMQLFCNMAELLQFFTLFERFSCF